MRIQRQQRLQARAFDFDRQYVLAEAPQDDSITTLKHLTIKTTFDLCLFQPSIDSSWSKITVRHTLAESDAVLTIPLSPSPFSLMKSESYRVSIFGTTALGADMGDESAHWFSKHLGKPVRLLFIAGSGQREIPGAAYMLNKVTALSLAVHENVQPQRIRFADAAPLLITSSASERDARARLQQTSQSEDIILRFRPNIHVDGGPSLPAYDEDKWSMLTILPSQEGRQVFIRCIFKTPRCLSLNVDLKLGGMVGSNRQLYGLLAKDRRVNSAFPHKPVFGQCACASPTGVIIKVGDELDVIERNDS
ncbi:hypothetical protein BDV97DRAFT_365865 [Delphinella strobiligena]|nr:hypothetical protein BDV97DRAFT_365865 [Delphinella strobiligena]